MAEKLYEFWLFYLSVCAVVETEELFLDPSFLFKPGGRVFEGGSCPVCTCGCSDAAVACLSDRTADYTGWPLVLAGGQKWWKLRQWRPSRTRTRSPGLAVWGRGWRCFSRTSTMRKTSSRALSLSSSLPSARRPLWWWEGMGGFSWKTLFSWSSRFQLPTGSVAERHVVHLCCPCCMCASSSLSLFL